MKNIGIIGYGNVGETLAKYINTNKELKLFWICSKHFKDVNIYPKTKLFSSISEIKNLPDTIFITSYDKQIKNISVEIANIFEDKLAFKNIIHTAGSFGVELLADCEIHGAVTIAAHPFQTFFSKEISCFNNIFWGIEINNMKYAEVINELITILNGHPFFLPQEIINNKALYHSIGVTVSNYVAGAIKLGTSIADKINLPQKEFFVPIINQTIKNCLTSIIHNDNNFPITGPIIRNDNETITKHIEALKNFDKEQQSYINFANGLKSLL